MDSEARRQAQQVEAIARRVVELLRSEELLRSSRRGVDASAVARELGVERDWVYAHAEELGAIRLGGPQGRLRFDMNLVWERLGGFGSERRRFARRSPGQQRASAKGRVVPRRATVKSHERQRRASGRTPATPPKRQQTGGSPHDEA